MNSPNWSLVLEQLSAAKAPGENVDYIVARDIVSAQFTFNKQLHTVRATCEVELRFDGDGRLEHGLATRMHSNTKHAIGIYLRQLQRAGRTIRKPQGGNTP